MIISTEYIDFISISAFMRGLKPDPIMTVSQWADEHRFLPEESARPGKFKMDVTPYNREIADRLSAGDAAQEIIFKKSSQCGATETGNNWLGYNMDIVPAPMLYVMPTDTMMKDTSKNRISKMIESTPRLQKKIGPSRAKDSKNTLLYKEYEGGFVKMVGANSPVGLASTPVKNVYMDEIDRYPLNVSGEGSALSLAETRTITYGATKKIFLTSTPTMAGISAIDNEFANTSQRYYHVPCPHCGKKQRLVFDQLRYTIDDYENTQYECIHCNELIPERYKTQMLAAGEWKSTFPEKESIYRYGYHINALYSPYGMYSWGNMAKDYERSKIDIPKLVAFTNTKLGEVYTEKEGYKPNWELLYERSHSANNICQANLLLGDVVFLTAGVDIQADRAEVEIVGWMKNKQSQQIDYRVIMGDTDSAEVWKDIEQLLTTLWLRSDNKKLGIRMMAVDSGFATKKVYEFVNKFSITQVIPVKGKDAMDTVFTPPRQVELTRMGKRIGTTKLYNIGVSILKSQLYGFLKQDIDKETGEIPEGYCFFPKRDHNYFKGLTAEELQSITNKKGHRIYQWVKKFERNEPLDCRIYAAAAKAIIGADRWNEARWNRELEDSGIADNATPLPKKADKKKSSFWGK